jgi:ABC-type sugar transport system ATPase subunit
VAGFVGIPAMNFIAGDSVLLPRADPAVVVGVRPEHVIIGQGVLDATVSVVEALGHETIVLLMAAGTEIAARAPADFRLAPGAAVKFSILHDQVHCFGALDGRRIARSQT